MRFVSYQNAMVKSGSKSRASPKARSKTADQILDLAEMLIQTRGYTAFSYQDIADDMGIRKASVHYHFPSKSDLGVSVIERYSNRFGAALDEIAGQESTSSMTMLDHYIEPYIRFSKTPDQVCLSGALAGEILALPDDMRQWVDRFFERHQSWLTRILKRGAERGEFTLTAPPEKMARFLFGALQGALLVKRTTGDTSQMRDVIAVMKAQLTADEKG